MKLLTNDWHGEASHFYLLIQFLEKPVKFDELHSQDIDWEMNLGEPLERAADRLRVLGCIEKASMRSHLELLTVDQLKKLLKKESLPVSGKKVELIGRITTQVDSGKLEVLVKRRQFITTEHGSEIAKAYITNPDRLLNYVRQLPNGDAHDKKRITKTVFIERIEWLIFDGLILGIAGNAVYDLLKGAFPDIISLLGKSREPIQTDRFGIYWVRIPAGYFWMGSNDGFSNEKPYHRVYLDEYWLSRTPVTNEQYKLFVEATSHQLPNDWKKEGVLGNKIRLPQGKENHPVVGVSWHDARAYCDWLSQATKDAVTLPSEAQWEKGARGTKGLVYPWGNRFDKSKGNFEVRETTSVGSYLEGASPYGVLDMSGNVLEWTSSLYKNYPYDAADGRECSDREGYRVLRGGSWNSSDGHARAASRSSGYPNGRISVTTTTVFGYVVLVPPSLRLSDLWAARREVTRQAPPREAGSISQGKRRKEKRRGLPFSFVPYCPDSN